MAALEAELQRWARDEMGLNEQLHEATIRRLCCGQCADIWGYVIKHVRSCRNVEKIRGNLKWLHHMEQVKAPRSPPPVLRELPLLRRNMEELHQLLGGAQQQALRLEAELGAGLQRRGAGLNRAHRLLLLAEAADSQRKQLKAALPVPPPLPGPLEAEPELEAAVAMGTEPEVLAATRALCRMREEAMMEMTKPRPLPEKQRLMAASNHQWLQAAQELLGRHSPRSVLWALSHMIKESIRELQAPPRSEDIEPNGEQEAPPTIETLIKDCWNTVGGLWALAHPIATRLPHMRQRLREIQEQMGEETRLPLLAAALGGVRASLLGGVGSLKGQRPLLNDPPTPQRQWEQLKRKVVKGRVHVLKQQRNLRILIGNNGTSSERILKGQDRIRAAAAAIAALPLAVEEKGRSLGGALGAMAALGPPTAPPPTPGATPLMGVCKSLGLPPYQDSHDALRLAIDLMEELRLLRAVGGASVDPAPIVTPPTKMEDEEMGVAEMLPRLRAVTDQCRQRIESWPRLQALVDQWWEQPAQWALATPPGSVPFSHWMERWSRATRGHAPSGPQSEPQP